MLITTGPIEFGTTNLNFEQFSGAGQVTAGNGLSKSGNTLSIDTGVTVDLNTAQTLTNKTLTAPTITNTTVTGGKIDNIIIGGTTPAAGSFTTLNASKTSTLTNVDITGDLTVTGVSKLPSVDIDGGAINNTFIGQSIPREGVFTTLTSNTNLISTGTANLNNTY